MTVLEDGSDTRVSGRAQGTRQIPAARHDLSGVTANSTGGVPMPLRLIPLLLAATLALTACGADPGADPEPSAATSDAAEEPVELDVAIETPDDGTAVTSGRITVSGTVSPPDASVDVNGQPMEVVDGTWSGRVRLELGDNELVATADGGADLGTATDTVDVRRKRTRAQRAAFLAAQRRKRQQRLARLRATAKPIDTRLLQKNPDKYAGQAVVVSGEIFQIQEGGADGNFLLMSTGCETAYDVRICDGPTVHVTYRGSNDKTEDDVVTVYGTVIGGLEYETRIGGTNFVASIAGEIIE
jgi:hypothetical protein